MKVVEPGVVYALENFTGNELQLLRFTRKKRDGSFDNGTTVEELLKVLIDKLHEFQKRSPSTDNEEAIDYLTKAQHCMNRRLRRKIQLKNGTTLHPGN